MSFRGSPLNLERYELRYVIPERLLEPISKYVEAFCELDHHSQAAKDGFYTVNNLYLDNPNLHLLNNNQNADAFSFNMRIRSYGLDSNSAYYFETKYRVRDFVKKKRSKILTSDWQRFLLEKTLPEDLLEYVDADSRKNLEDFLFMKRTYKLAPVVLNQYERKAYFSNVDEYARVTFDRKLGFSSRTNYSLIPDETPVPQDLDTTLVMELKCEKKIPVWMVDLIRHFNLTSSAYLKYECPKAEVYRPHKSEGKSLENHN